MGLGMTYSLNHTVSILFYIALLAAFTIKNKNGGSLNFSFISLPSPMAENRVIQLSSGVLLIFKKRNDTTYTVSVGSNLS